VFDSRYAGNRCVRGKVRSKEKGHSIGLAKRSRGETVRVPVQVARRLSLSYRERTPSLQHLPSVLRLSSLSLYLNKNGACKCCKCSKAARNVPAGDDFILQSNPKVDDVSTGRKRGEPKKGDDFIRQNKRRREPGKKCHARTMMHSKPVKLST
jgi:hypothetical protein